MQLPVTSSPGCEAGLVLLFTSLMASPLLVLWWSGAGFQGLPIRGSKFQSSPAPDLEVRGYKRKPKNSPDCGSSGPPQVPSQATFQSSFTIIC